MQVVPPEQSASVSHPSPKGAKTTRMNIRARIRVNSKFMGEEEGTKVGVMVTVRERVCGSFSWKGGEESLTGGQKNKQKEEKT